MFRAGDIDSVYCLFSTVAVLALEECRKHPNAILMYGFAWAVPRFFYDGFAFFNRGVVGKMSDKIVVDHVGDVTYPLRKMLLQINWQLLLACISIAITVWIVSIVRHSRVKTGEGEGGGRGEKARKEMVGILSDGRGYMCLPHRLCSHYSYHLCE